VEDRATAVDTVYKNLVKIVYVVAEGDSGIMSMPAGFRRHLVHKTLRHDFHCDIAETRFVSRLIIIKDILINRQIECYLNNMINLRPLTLHIMPSYTHKMAIVYTVDSVTSPPCVW